jgi:hypothetical protein
MKNKIKKMPARSKMYSKRFILFMYKDCLLVKGILSCVKLEHFR